MTSLMKGERTLPKVQEQGSDLLGAISKNRVLKSASKKKVQQPQIRRFVQISELQLQNVPKALLGLSLGWGLAGVKNCRK